MYNSVYIYRKDTVLKNLDRIRYTLEHRKMYRKVEKELFGKVRLSSWFHDLDKVLLYPFFDYKTVHTFHRKHSRHHNRATTYKDFCSKVVDWECARFTKPDKPLNAFDTLYTYYPELADDILPILKRLGIAHPTEMPQ